MSTFAFLLLCVQACLIQAVYSQCVCGGNIGGGYLGSGLGVGAGLGIGYGYAGGLAEYAGALGAAEISLPVPSGPCGGIGNTEVAVAGGSIGGYLSSGLGLGAGLGLGYGYAGGLAEYAGGLGAAGISLPAPYGPYGGIGNGEVTVAGDIKIAGKTYVIGQVPVRGVVQFNGNVPAYGSVVISGGCYSPLY